MAKKKREPCTRCGRSGCSRLQHPRRLSRAMEFRAGTRRYKRRGEVPDHVKRRDKMGVRWSDWLRLEFAEMRLARRRDKERRRRARVGQVGRKPITQEA